MSLDNIQYQFLDSIFSDRSLNEHPFVAQVFEGNGYDVLERIAIYRGNRLCSGLATLEQVYPICMELLGEKYFQQLCQGYMQENPSEHWDLNLYGTDFPLYIRTVSETSAALKDLDYLPQLAELEWLLHQAYYQAESPEFDFQAFEALTEQQQLSCYFHRSPSLALLQTEWPLYEFWQSWQQNDLPQTLPGCSGQYLCIHRKDYQPVVEIISKEQFQLLGALSRQTLFELSGDPLAGDLLAMLPELIEKKWISHFGGDGDV